MTICIIDDEQYCWIYKKIGEVRIFFRGLFWHQNKLYQGASACEKLVEIFGHSSHLADIKEKLLVLKGHFSFVVETPFGLIGVVDKIRSYPLFYSLQNNILYISNSARKLQKQIPTKKNSESILEFRMAGYVTGIETLLKGLYQLQAGEALIGNKGLSSVERVRYFQFYSDDIVPKEDDELIEELHQVTIKSFSDMIDTLDGRPVWVPLSGGLDSRLVLTMLMELKYDNIVTFSYGIPGDTEVERAGNIAKFLGVKWHKVIYKPKETKGMFYTKERENYYQFADGLCSTPFLNDFYALWILRDKKMIEEDAVFINGQTGDFITGGHIPKNLASKNINHDIQFLINEIIERHFSLWINLKNKENIKRMSSNILTLLNLNYGSKLTKQDIAKYYELWEWQERQSKFVVNGQRIYDWYGFDWRLPLWSDEFLEFWKKIEWKKKIGQYLFKIYLSKKNTKGIFDKYLDPHPVKKWVMIGGAILFLYSDLTGKDREMMKRKYMHYFMNYASFYNQKTYIEYLKDSYWHRNHYSYLSKEVLKTLQ